MWRRPGSRSAGCSSPTRPSTISASRPGRRVFNWGRATVGTVPFVWIGAHPIRRRRRDRRSGARARVVVRHRRRGRLLHGDRDGSPRTRCSPQPEEVADGRAAESRRSRPRRPRPRSTGPSPDEEQAEMKSARRRGRRARSSRPQRGRGGPERLGRRGRIGPAKLRMITSTGDRSQYHGVNRRVRNVRLRHDRGRLERLGRRARSRCGGD